jgi:hypothetical protein
MSHIKNSFVLLVRLLLASVAMFIAYMVSTLVMGQTETTLTPEETSWAGIALVLVSTINALVLAYPILRSRWHGLKLIGAVFVIQFGVETFLTQIESLYFNRALQISTSEMVGLVSAGAIRALIFAPLAIWFLGRMKHAGRTEENALSPNSPGLIWRFAGLTVLYPIIYFLFGYFVAWQWEETRLFYTGTTDILPFVIHFRGLFASDPYIIPFQLMRGALWTALAALIVSMMKAKRWESALAVALVFAGLLSSGIGLFPNPYMPSMVRQSHFYEILSSMLLFGGIVGWTLHRKKQQSGQEQVAKAIQNPNISVEAR